MFEYLHIVVVNFYGFYHEINSDCRCLIRKKEILEILRIKNLIQWN